MLPDQTTFIIQHYRSAGILRNGNASSSRMMFSMEALEEKGEKISIISNLGADDV